MSSILKFNNQDNIKQKKQQDEISKIEQEQQEIEEKAKDKAKEIASDFNISGVSEKQNKEIYNFLLDNCKKMNNYDFFSALQIYSGYLTNEQRQHIIETYVKYDGEIQIKYHDVNLKAREQMAKMYRAKLNEAEGIFNKDNIHNANVAAAESKKMEDLVKSFLVAKEEAKTKSVVYKEGEGTSKFGDLMNLKSRRVILTAKNGEVVEYNNREEIEKLQNYRNKVNMQYTVKENAHSIENDPEYN